MASSPITDHFDRLVGLASAHYAVYPAGGDGPSGMVHRVRPTPGRPWTTLYTDGMSARALPDPDDGLPLPDRHVELVVGCPKGWFSDDDGGPVDMSGSDEGDWLVELVQWMMELPWRIDSPVYAGLVLPNGDPPEPYADSVPFCAALLAPVASLPEDAQDIEIEDGPTVRLLSLVLLDAAELSFAQTSGVEALYERLDAAGVFERVDPERESSVDVAEG